MNKVKIGYVILLLSLCTVLFQNCDSVSSPENARRRGIPLKTGGNGGGYVGITIEGPAKLQAGSKVELSVQGGVAPYKVFLDGQGEIEQLSEANFLYRVPADASEGDTLIMIEDSNGSMGAKFIEIIVIQAEGVFFGNEFGRAISWLGNRIVIGAPGENIWELGVGGAVHSFFLNGSVVTEVDPITAGGKSRHRAFGWSLDQTENYLLVGAPGSQVNGNLRAGEVHLYRSSDGTSWELMGGPIIHKNPQKYHRFGSSVSIDGENFVVGSCRSANNSVSIYNILGDGVELAREILSPDEAFAYGIKVLLKGNYLFVSGLLNPMGKNPYKQPFIDIFEHSNGNWIRSTRLISQGGKASNKWGESISIVGDTLLVTSRGEVNQLKNGKSPSCGAVHFYEKLKGKWTIVRNFKPTEAGDDECHYALNFGKAAGFSANYLVVGAPGRRIGNMKRVGAAYVWKKGTDGEWVFHRKISLENAVQNALFGNGVLVQGSRAIISKVGGGTAFVFNLD